jgi:hypothetical protein
MRADFFLRALKHTEVAENDRAACAANLRLRQCLQDDLRANAGWIAHGDGDEWFIYTGWH